MAATVYNSVELEAYPTDPLFNSGVKLRTVIATITIDASSADGDVVILAKGITYDTKVVGIRLPTVVSGITQLSDVDFGLYKTEAMAADDLVSAISGAVIDKDILVDGIDLSSAKAANVDILSSDRAKSIAALLSSQTDKEPAGGVNICATINTQGSGTGTIEVAIDLAFPA